MLKYCLVSACFVRGRFDAIFFFAIFGNFRLRLRFWLNCCEQIMCIFLESGAYVIFLHIQSFFHGTVTMLRSARPVRPCTVADPWFSRVGHQPRCGGGGCAPTYYLLKCLRFPKTAWKWKKLDLDWRRLPRNPAKFALWFFIYNYDLQWKMCNLFCIYRLCM